MFACLQWIFLRLMHNTWPKMVFLEDFTHKGVSVTKLMDCSMKNDPSNWYISVIHKPEIFSNDLVSVIEKHYAANDIPEIFHTYRFISGQVRRFQYEKNIKGINLFPSFMNLEQLLVCLRLFPMTKCQLRRDTYSYNPIFHKFQLENPYDTCIKQV